MKNVCAVVLAAGRGSRMKSELPKVLHTIQGRPLIVFSLQTLQSLNLSQIITVVKHQAELVLPVVVQHSQIAYQGDEYGTAKAVEAALPIVDNVVDTIMVINGDDSMFYGATTFKDVIAQHEQQKNAITFITLLKENPTGFGRIVYDRTGKFKEIVEEKDATPKQKQIKEINDGVYLFDKKFLNDNIKKLKPSKVTGEYYLTDLINVAKKQKRKVGTYLLQDSSQFFGISTQQDVAQANQMFTSAKNI